MRNVAVTGLGMLITASTLVAQDFDLSRADIRDSTTFVPFVVTETRSLRSALDDRTIARDTPVLLLETAGGPLGLVTAQMAYHHLAQGEMAGEPWMVSF